MLTPHSSQPLAITSLFSLYEFGYFRALLWVETCNICPHVTDFFSLSQLSPRFISTAACVRISFLLRLNNIVCVYHILFMCWWMLCCFCLLAVVVSTLWTWVYRYLFASLLSFLLGRHPEVEFLDHMILLYIIYWENHNIFCSSCTILHCQQCTTVMPVSP